MTAPLSCWRCDNCGEPIDRLQDGYVVWHSRYGKVDDLNIIHKGRCNDGSHVSSAELSRFLGPEGLSFALSLVSAGPIRLAGGHESPRTPANLDAFVDFLRRVQVPYYEEARPKFGEPTVREAYRSMSDFGPYRVDALKSISEGS